jgi:hypothetical protein
MNHGNDKNDIDKACFGRKVKVTKIYNSVFIG